MYRKLTILLNDSAKNNEVLVFVLTAIGDFFTSGNDINIAAMEFSSTNAQNEGNLVFK